ncbi:MAG: hypothetical protein ACTHN5_07385, partial [Phycisphaerae bacterium]
MPRLNHSNIRHSNLIRHSSFVIRHFAALLTLATITRAATPPLIPFPTTYQPHPGTFTFTHPTLLASKDLLPRAQNFAGPVHRPGNNRAPPHARRGPPHTHPHPPPPPNNPPT